MERIGLVLVHGIGEQKRFAHLDSEIRGLIEGLRRRPSARFTIEILGSGSATYNSEHDTWASGNDPSARITFTEPNRELEINVHEVWWADINEPYSLAKQLRFWAWGLSMWSFPRSESRDDLKGFQAMYAPSVPDRDWRDRALVRCQLFLVGLFFLVTAFSLGAAVFLAKRLFGFEPPDFVRVFVNYISGVKLYNQNTRQGPGLLRNPRGFLDTLSDPPRVSVRRRIIQAIVSVACRKPEEEYDRWYILAHSLGSVIAFNGVMENGQAFANYLPHATWKQLKTRNWAGPARPKDWVRVPPGTMSPDRPVWLAPDELVYRDEIFMKFRGLLTYGSPLGKFAELWKARVPVNKVEKAFQPGTEWINVFDGRDPVAGPLKAFAADNVSAHGVTPAHCPPLRNFSYIASNILLLSHIRYLTAHRGETVPQLVDVVSEWLVTGQPFAAPPEGQGRWTNMRVYWRRVGVSLIWWAAAFLVFAVLGTLTALGLLDITCALIRKIFE